MNKWMITSYYTSGTFYEQYAQQFVASMERYKILYHVVGVPNLKSWRKNTCYKPTFLAGVLKSFPDTDIVWVDCDAEFKSYPVLFNTIDCDIAVHLFDRKLHQHSSRLLPEVLSGTVYLRNNVKVRSIVDTWVKECANNPNIWDQKSLEKVLHGEYYQLPPEYCTIERTMNRIKNPVILHHQCSRIVRRNKGRLTGVLQSKEGRLTGVL